MKSSSAGEDVQGLWHEYRATRDRTRTRVNGVDHRQNQLFTERSERGLHLIELRPMSYLKDPVDLWLMPVESSR